jgi:hypothetical protein
VDFNISQIAFELLRTRSDERGPSPAYQNRRCALTQPRLPRRVGAPGFNVSSSTREDVTLGWDGCR